MRRSSIKYSKVYLSLAKKGRGRILAVLTWRLRFLFLSRSFNLDCGNMIFLPLGR